MIRNLKDLGAYLGVPSCFEGDLKAAISRLVYKYTECGCTFDTCDLGSEVYVSGYAEGADAECERYTLVFPFSEERWDDTLAQADEDGCIMWHLWNEEQYDYEDDNFEADCAERARDMNATLQGGW